MEWPPFSTPTEWHLPSTSPCSDPHSVYPWSDSLPTHGVTPHLIYLWSDSLPTHVTPTQYTHGVTVYQPMWPPLSIPMEWQSTHPCDPHSVYPWSDSLPTHGVTPTQYTHGVTVYPPMEWPPLSIPMEWQSTHPWSDPHSVHQWSESTHPCDPHSIYLWSDSLPTHVTPTHWVNLPVEWP